MSDNQGNGRVIPVAIEDEIKESYLNYAMSVIVSRALPDVRDGLKPVHRRILYSMEKMGLRSNTAPKKSGRIVGDVLGKYHPHGDQSIYAALVRLAQDFNLRYPMIDGQGNYGSLDGDPPAAMRYTEARLTKIAEELLRDIDRDTVDFVSNYDDALEEPSVMPAGFPFLLTNGGTGIAVGMATNIPPHNLREVAKAITHYIDNPDIAIDELQKYIPGPDFPTGGVIYGTRGIRNAYTTGRGQIVVRSRVMVEEMRGGKMAMVVTEIPYQVNKATLIKRIADLVRDRRVDGISDLRDESDRDGLRIVIELKRGASPDIVLNQLYTHSQLQENHNVNCVALVHGRPLTLTLKDLIVHFVDHRRIVVIRRAKFDLRKAEERAHVLEGLQIALDNIDAVVKLIRESKDVPTARSGLRSQFELSKIQAQAILDMRLQKLTNLEARKIVEELEQLRSTIARLKALLADERAILGVVRSETLNLARIFGDDRRTQIIPQEIDQLNVEDLIEKEAMVVLITNQGYLKRTALSAYRSQARGGRGSISSNLREDDLIRHLFIASTHDHIMLITNMGKAYWLRVHEIPEASRSAKGYHIRNLLAVSTDEEITAAVSIDIFSDNRYLFLATLRGIVKKVALSQFSNARTRGIAAIKLDDDDHLVSAMLTSGDNELLLVTNVGKALRFHETQVRPMGRATHGVHGIRMAPEHSLIGAVIVTDDRHMLIVSMLGQGKRTEFSEFRPHGRGTHGQNAYAISAKTGNVRAILAVAPSDEIVITTHRGISVRLRVRQISTQLRGASGVRLINVSKGDRVADVERTSEETETETEK